MLLGRPHGSELPEKQQVVDDLERAAGQERQNLERRGEGRAPAIAGLASSARLRGTEEKLAAAARSRGVTTAMT